MKRDFLDSKTIDFEIITFQIRLQCIQATAIAQQFTYGVVREGVIAENFPQISAKFPQNFRTLSWRNKT